MFVSEKTNLQARGSTYLSSSKEAHPQFVIAKNSDSEQIEMISKIYQ